MEIYLRRFIPNLSPATKKVFYQVYKIYAFIRYSFYFNKILDINKISLTKKQSEYLLQILDQDICKYNHILEDLLLIRKGKITDDNIAFVVDTFSNKSGEDKISENLEKIFTEKISVKQNIEMYYSDKFLFSFLIHENYPYNIGMKIKKS